jgi:GTP pyrophosphokinase
MNTYTPDKAKLIASIAHNGQKRKDGKAYINHPLAVARRFETGSIAWQVALLHDVLEDTPTTEADLFNSGVPFVVVQAVKTLTKKKETSYPDFITHIIKSGNRVAIKVKIADILHNLSDQPSTHQLIKYGNALTQLAKTFGKNEKILDF